ncbi:hypothetical protein RFI_24133 [Reticulomyxa filosa]|uniref:Tyrosine specific protein phosphatases domain-containing protein n=1 Tax=Reticulomyxa filosa TaxID=46433 RepID=X6MH70_RETFI|nr:hypothetical protein RFI_24133 [Reticulomyxa filosa]|eukprot:ETO13244.1 hypothetical protein RFI_24133 [Reticulomyxa filosa]
MSSKKKKKKKTKQIIEFSRSDPTKSAANISYSNFFCRLKVARKWRYYFDHVLIYCTLFSLSTLCAFAMSPIDDLPNRLSMLVSHTLSFFSCFVQFLEFTTLVCNHKGFIFTLVLTMVAFQFVVDSKMPDVPYLTHLDIYVRSVFFFMFFVAIQTCFLSWCDTGTPSSQHKMHRIDRITFWVGLGWLITFHIIWVTHARRVMAYERSKLKMRGQDLKGEVKEGGDLVLGLLHTANVFSEADVYDSWSKYIQLARPVSGEDILEKAGMTEEEKQVHSKEYEEALVIMKQGVVKVDHFENIYRLEPKIEGIPNLRQTEGFWIFGCGQPTVFALAKIFSEFKNHLTHNIRLGGTLSIDDVNTLQNELANVVRIKNEKNHGLFEYHKDTYALLPADRKDMVLTEPVRGPDTVKTLVEMYAEQNTNSFPVKLERLPVNDERAPDAEDIDTLVDRVRNYTDNKTAIVFNCQMGKGRTTVGMICSCLIKKQCGEFVENMTSKYTTIWPNATPLVSSEEAKDNAQYLQHISTNTKPEDEKQSEHKLSEIDMRNGNYTLVKKLVETLTNNYKLDGEKIKSEVDDIINRNQHLQNMRVCIYSTKLWYVFICFLIYFFYFLPITTQKIIIAIVRYDRETMERRAYWKEISGYFLERYLVLIAFNAYLHESAKNDFNTKYSEWIQSHADLLNILTVKSFDWD